MKTWGGSALFGLYNTAGTNEAFYGTVVGEDVSFTITFVATKSGISFPLELLALDAEATGMYESITYTTNGGDWELVESKGTGGVFSGVGTKTLVAEETISGNTSIYSSKEASSLNVNIDQGGYPH